MRVGGEEGERSMLARVGERVRSRWFVMGDGCGPVGEGEA
jgi:hypothetical protein